MRSRPRCEQERHRPRPADGTAETRSPAATLGMSVPVRSLLPMPRVASLLLAVLLAACSGSAAATNTPPAPSSGGAATPQGLIAYASDHGIGVLDPATGKGTIVSPMTPGVFY